MKSFVEKLKNIDKKVWIYLVTVIVIVILGVVVSKIIYMTSNSNKSYNEVETILKNAGVSYYKENTSSLPKEDGESVSIGDSVLAEEGYMKSIDKLIKKGSCTGKVTVTKKDDLYNYVAYLDCGKDYKTIEFSKKLKENIVSEGDGLYQDAFGYIYRGEDPDNYVSIDGNLWRIVSVGEDDTIELISTLYVEMIKWDDRYNASVNYNAGYNDFSHSRLKDHLDNIYNNKLGYAKNKYFISNSIKDKLTSVNNCIDKYNETTKDFSNCNTKNDALVSTINLGEYIKVSLDSKCAKAEDKECQNYNYLALGEEYWTLSGNAANTSEVFSIRSSGAIDSDDASDFKGIYPVIRLNDTIMYKSGTGTIDDPYMIR